MGWVGPYDARLTPNASTGELVYRSESGQQTRFVPDAAGSSNYVAKGFDGTLVRESDGSYTMTMRDQRVFRFDTGGLLTQIVPRFTAATTLAYSGGRLSSITDPAGRAVALTYTAADPSLVERVTLPDGRYMQYGYSDRHLTSVRDARGRVWTLSYNASGLLTAILDPSGRYRLQNVQYDASGRVISEQNGAGDTLVYAYSNDGVYDVTTVTVPGRGDWTYQNRDNMLFRVTDPLGCVTGYTYDGQGRTASITDPRGNTRSYLYDDHGNVVEEDAPASLGSKVTRTYTATNDLLSETDGRGNTTRYTYAGDADAGADYQSGQLKSVTDRAGAVTTFTYWGRRCPRPSPQRRCWGWSRRSSTRGPRRRR